jgi:hypothetical protein
MAEHKDYNMRLINAKHLGLDGVAWLQHAWDDWYYCMVKGTWGNGNPAEGVYCRERAKDVERYLLPGKMEE